MAMPTNYPSYLSIAKGLQPPASPPLVAEIPAPAHITRQKFAYQSYFDSSLLEGALLTQAFTAPIVASTLTNEDVPGYAVGLHPSSEAPIAIQFKLSAQSSAGAPVILKPGQFITPAGIPPADRKLAGGFVGFTYGLPFGWLGGGMVQLVVCRTPEAAVDWPGNPEVIFHRVRIPILQPSAVTGDARNNWPSRFPWTSAPFVQRGAGLIAVEPTRVLVALRGLSALASPADCRLIFQGTNEFSRDSTDAVVLTGSVYEDITFPSFAHFGSSGNLVDQSPVLVLNSAIARLGADDGGLAAVDISGAALLNGAYIDVVRYGRL